jgi:hyperosmotically inducible protein
MKNFGTLIIAMLLFTALQFHACKSEKSDKNMDDTTALKSQEPTPMPESVAVDDDLNNKIKNIIKDYPGVTAAIRDGVITLTGSIDKAKLPRLMESLKALKAKQIDNDLIINK